MAVEDLIQDLQLLERPIGKTEKQKLLMQLRATPVEGVDGHRLIRSWGFGNYFHSLQDAYFVAAFDGVPDSDIAVAQACFLKDLEWYLSALPEGYDAVRASFNLILNVGTSAYWKNDLELPKALYRIYDELDGLLLRPWAEQQENLSG